MDYLCRKSIFAESMFENSRKKGAEDISHESIWKLDKEVKEVNKENVLDSNGICEEVDAALVYEKTLDGELGEIGTMDVVDEFEQILSSLEQKRGEMRQFKENEEFKESSQQQLRKALDEKFSFGEDDESYSENECNEDARVYDAKVCCNKA